MVKTLEFVVRSTNPLEVKSLLSSIIEGDFYAIHHLEDISDVDMALLLPMLKKLHNSGDILAWHVEDEDEEDDEAMMEEFE